MPKTLVEYISKPTDPGYVPAERAQKWFRRGGQPLDFLPKADYDNRRVEEFVTEREAQDFVDGSANTRCFQIATDLWAAEDRKHMESIVQDALTAVVARIEALEALRGNPAAQVAAAVRMNGVKGR